jgi:hypothetical protein
MSLGYTLDCPRVKKNIRSSCCRVSVQKDRSLYNLPRGPALSAKRFSHIMRMEGQVHLRELPSITEKHPSLPMLSSTEQEESMGREGCFSHRTLSR